MPELMLLGKDVEEGGGVSCPTGILDKRGETDFTVDAPSTTCADISPLCVSKPFFRSVQTCSLKKPGLSIDLEIR
jgi:hypothetical protein